MADEPKPKTPQEIWGQHLEGLQSQASGLGENSEAALADGAGSELTAEELLGRELQAAGLGSVIVQGFRAYAGRSVVPGELQGQYGAATVAETRPCAHALLSRVFDGLGGESLHCSCGLHIGAMALQRLGIGRAPAYDKRANDLADTCGVLKKENTELLAANARLSRDLESAHRQLAALRRGGRR
jgi:hypothetical protein